MMYATSLIKSLKEQSNILLLTILKILYYYTRINSTHSRTESPKSQQHNKLFSRMQQLVETHQCRSVTNQAFASLVTRQIIGPNFCKSRAQARFRNYLTTPQMDKTLRCHSNLKSSTKLIVNWQISKINIKHCTNNRRKNLYHRDLNRLSHLKRKIVRQMRRSISLWL